ncbi:FUSC family protein [Mobilicoccus caccae]|nr:FUSC family protein [Mobilicoccus caccae]
MKAIPGHRHLRAAARFNAVPARWRVALKTAATSVVVLGGSHLLGDLRFGMLATLGCFTVLYGAMAPARYRLRLLATVGFGLVSSVAVGALTVHNPWLDVPALATTGAVATFLCVALRVGPPGAMFFVLVHGVGGLAALHGTPYEVIVGAVALGAVMGVVGGMSDLVLDPTGPERHAVEAAENAMDRYEAETRRENLVAVRYAASSALHRGWTTVTDGGGHPSFTSRLWAVQDRYAAAAARVTGAELGFHQAPWGSVAGEEDEFTGAVLETDDALTTAAARRLEAEKIWDTSLGRPAAGPILLRALRWPSEPLLVAGRVFVATLIAAGIARTLGAEHAHWAAAFATLVLHQGGTREAQTVRGIQRLGGTVVGLGLLLLISWIGPTGWPLILLVAGLQFFIEMVVVANYGLAVVAITPLALTVGAYASGGSSSSALAAERGLDTVLAIVVAFAVLYLVGRRTDVPVLRSYARDVVDGIGAVLSDLGAGRIETHAARENRRHLHFALLESEEYARRTLADSPAASRRIARWRRRCRIWDTSCWAWPGTPTRARRAPSRIERENRCRASRPTRSVGVARQRRSTRTSSPCSASSRGGDDPPDPPDDSRES